MNLDKYELGSGEQLEVYEFVSVGPRGSINNLAVPLQTDTHKLQ